MAADKTKLEDWWGWNRLFVREGSRECRDPWVMQVRR